jgi:lipoprotein-anchoring transpeptidase ErfK/SrfK
VRGSRLSVVPRWAALGGVVAVVGALVGAGGTTGTERHVGRGAAVATAVQDAPRGSARRPVLVDRRELPEEAQAKVVSPTAPLPGALMPQAFSVADAAVPSVELFTAPGVSMGRALRHPTKYDLPLVFRVMGQRGSWLEVQVPMRPNGLRAIVRASDVTRRLAPHWIRVELNTRSVTVFRGDVPVLTALGAIGRPTSPTPEGWFYIDASVRLTDPSGPYGAGQLSLSGFSEVYTSFGGGEGQIALHGTNAPGLLGQPTSNGCVRLANRDLLAIQRLAVTGTPVLITR